MPDRNVVQQSFDHWGSTSGMTKRSGSWYRSSVDVVSISDLQKSQYGVRYYINQAFYLRQLGDVAFPKEQVAHVRMRLGSLVPSAERLEELLDLDSPMQDGSRQVELNAILADYLSPVVEQGLSVAGLRDLAAKGSVLVAGAAQSVLSQH